MATEGLPREELLNLGVLPADFERLQFLWQAAGLYLQTCPALARRFSLSVTVPSMPYVCNPDAHHLLHLLLLPFFSHRAQFKSFARVHLHGLGKLAAANATRSNCIRNAYTHSFLSLHCICVFYSPQGLLCQRPVLDMQQQT
jgi:hypothetical protein